MSAQSSKLVDGRKVVGRFDSYTFPPLLKKKGKVNLAV